MRINNKGFSLVELMVSVAIMSVILTIATGMLTSASRYFEKQAAMVELHNEAQLVTNYLSEAVMEATAMEISYDAAGNGVFKLFKEDSKGNQRIMYYDKGTGSLYMVTFRDNAEPDPSAYTDVGYLVSDEVSEITISIERGVETSPEDVAAAVAEAEAPAEPGTPADPDAPEEAPVYVVRNPVRVKIVFTINHNKVSGEFEITAGCRNTLDEVKITNADGTTEILKAYNR